jgi:hypothetical protein
MVIGEPNHTQPHFFLAIFLFVAYFINEVKEAIVFAKTFMVNFCGR